MNAQDYWNQAAKDPDVRYKYIADEWASTEEFIQLIEATNTKWNEVIEIGCGIGRLLVPLADKHKACQFYGIDIADEMIKQAPRRKNIQYQTVPKEADLIYSMLVFQHITTADKVTYLRFAKERLREGGVMYLQFVVGDENAPYSYQLSEDEMQLLVRNAGLKIDTVVRGIMHPDWCFIKAVA